MINDDGSVPEAMVCRFCGCSDPAPCLTQDPITREVRACSWIEDGRCSECVEDVTPRPLLYDGSGQPVVFR